MRHVLALPFFLILAAMGCQPGHQAIAPTPTPTPSANAPGQLAFIPSMQSIVSVGESADLTVTFYSSPRPLVWRVAEGDEGRVAIDGGRYRALAPGGARLIAVTGSAYEGAAALVAVRAVPAPEARPLAVPPGHPGQLSAHGFRVFQSEREWRELVRPPASSADAGTGDMPELKLPPVDFTRHSVLMLLLDDTTATGGVVTHFEGEAPLTVHLTYPWTSSHGLPQTDGYMVNAVSLFEIPKVSTDDVRVLVRSRIHNGLLPAYVPPTSPPPDPTS